MSGTQVFNSIEIDPATRSVRVDQQRVGLHERAFELLSVLAGEPDKVFAPAELSAALWPGRRMDETNLRVQVHALRKALGPAVVVNLRQRGYRLGVPVQVLRDARADGNLPVWAGALVGRQLDAVALQRLIDGHRCVSVVGPAGIGKTRLAQHVARTLAPRWSGGVWWIDLATIAQGAQADVLLAQAIAQALRLQTALLVGEGATQRLAQALAGWQALLLLDNAEHLAGDDGPLRALLRLLLETAPGLTLLVTSQQTLRLAEEWVYRLGPLGLPPPGASADEARAAPALQLLEQRAAAAHPAFVLADGDLCAAAALVRRLDGLALAIEMAAAHLPVVGVQGLLDQLSRPALLLQGHADPAQGRHATLRAALDWSHGLLSASQQMVLRRLSVFAGPFTADVAQHVVADAGLDPVDALRAIVALTDKSLLQVDLSSCPGLPARLRLLDSTRLYADERLGESAARAGDGDERQATQRRHARVMAALAREACEHFHVASDADWSARWLPHHDDLMLGFDRALSFGDVESAAQIIEVLVLGANITGRVEPALLRADAARELARHAAPLARARLVGWGSNLPRSDRSRVEAGLQRVQLWRDVSGQEGRQGLCTSLAMLAVACEEAGDRTGADSALAECEQLESGAWPVRLRRRCSWVALSRIALLRNEAPLRSRADALSRRLNDELAALGAWREWSIVQAYLAQVMRLEGRPRDAAELLRELSRRRLQWGFDLDAGLTMGMVCAALVDAACDDEPGRCPVQGTLAWEEAGAAALQALERLAPLPALIRHFLEPLALLACRLGDPAQGSQLLAGAERMRQAHQYATDSMNARAARLAREAIEQNLARSERRRAEARGSALDPADLRLEALAWCRKARQRAGTV